MSTKRTSALWRAGLLSVLASLGGVALAQALKGVADPTRPPPGMLLKQAGTPDAAASAASAAASAASVPAVVRDMALTGVRYDLARGVGVALINGEVVAIGEKVDGMTLVSVGRDDVVLKGPTGVRRLTLFPEAVDQHEAVKARTAKRGRKESQ